MLQRLTDITPVIMHPDIDEMAIKFEKPRVYAARIAGEKLARIAEKVENMPEFAEKNAVIICADTVCSRGSFILPKAENSEDVQKCMKMLSGRNHDVFTAISAKNLKTGQTCHKISHTKVKFKHLSQKDIEDMVKSGSGIGKAGGYTINGFAESFIIQINGSYSGIVGFPLYEVRNILVSFGIL